MAAEWIKNGFAELADAVMSIGVVDIADILCLTVMFYYIFKFIRDRRAGKLTLGVLLFVALLFTAELTGMRATRFILTNVFQIGIITLVILFQPELRSALEKMGNQPIRSLRSLGDRQAEPQTLYVIDAVCEAAGELSDAKTGALIVFERETKLGDLILTGTVVNADISPFLIRNIFFNKAPLHDGAVIIRGGRLYAAGCLLPLSTNADIIKDLGTRHRAAIGMSENSDAVIVVVSEESGIISVAREGVMRRMYTPETLKTELVAQLIKSDERQSRVRTMFGKNKKNRAAKNAPAEKSEDREGGGDE
jgi:diadenylate cyclase